MWLRVYRLGPRCLAVRCERALAVKSLCPRPLSGSKLFSTNIRVQGPGFCALERDSLEVTSLVGALANSARFDRQLWPDRENCLYTKSIASRRNSRCRESHRICCAMPSIYARRVFLSVIVGSAAPLGDVGSLGSGRTVGLIHDQVLCK